MLFNNKLKMKDLFQNPEMASVFPQFGAEDRLQNVYSFDWVDKKVKEYLKNALNAKEDGNGLSVEGKKSSVLKDVKSMKWTIESFFNNLPSIVKNIKKNTPVYTPFKYKRDFQKLKTNEQKLAMLDIILDNLNYNPDLESLNSVKVYGTKMPYFQRQSLWMQRVGYRRKEWQK